MHRFVFIHLALAVLFAGAMGRMLMQSGADPVEWMLNGSLWPWMDVALLVVLAAIVAIGLSTRPHDATAYQLGRGLKIATAAVPVVGLAMSGAQLASAYGRAVELGVTNSDVTAPTYAMTLLPAVIALLAGAAAAALAGKFAGARRAA